MGLRNPSADWEKVAIGTPVIVNLNLDCERASLTKEDLQKGEGGTVISTTDLAQTANPVCLHV